MSEEELISKCLKKDPGAQRELYQRYAPAMLGVCRRYVSDLPTAEDVLQDGFIRVYSKLSSFAGSGSLAGWIRKIIVNTTLEHIRRKKDLELIENDSQISNLYDTDNSAVSKLTTDELLKYILELPEGYRTIFNLYVIEGYSHKEISELLGISEKTSQSQLTRARKTLQNNIQNIIER